MRRNARRTGTWHGTPGSLRLRNGCGRRARPERQIHRILQRVSECGEYRRPVIRNPIQKKPVNRFKYRQGALEMADASPSFAYDSATKMDRRPRRMTQAAWNRTGSVSVARAVRRVYKPGQAGIPGCFGCRARGRATPCPVVHDPDRPVDHVDRFAHDVSCAVAGPLATAEHLRMASPRDACVGGDGRALPAVARSVTDSSSRSHQAFSMPKTSLSIDFASPNNIRLLSL